MSHRVGIVALALAAALSSHPVSALDYFLDWRFKNPISVLPAWLIDPSGEDSLVYNQDTGELAYRPATPSTWNPPDLASRTGQFNIDAPLPPVLLTGYSPPDPLHRPVIETDVELGSQIVPGSEAIRIGYDHYVFWPGKASDPWILANWGLTSLPSAYDFGRILPPGLTKEFLEQDLYSTSRVLNVVVVPEPSTLVVAMALGAWVHRSRRRHPGNRVSLDD